MDQSTALEQYQQHGIEVLSTLSDRQWSYLLTLRTQREQYRVAVDSIGEPLLDNHLLAGIYCAASEPLQQRLLDNLNTVRRTEFLDQLDCNPRYLKEGEEDEVLEQLLAETVQEKNEEALLKSLALLDHIPVGWDKEEEDHSWLDAVDRFLHGYRLDPAANVVEQVKGWLALLDQCRWVPCSILSERIYTDTKSEPLRQLLASLLSSCSDQALEQQMDQIHQQVVHRVQERYALIQTAVLAIMDQKTMAEMLSMFRDSFSMVDELELRTAPVPFAVEMTLEEVIGNLLAYGQVAESEGVLALARYLDHHEDEDPFVLYAFRWVIDGYPREGTVRLIENRIDALIANLKRLLSIQRDALLLLRETRIAYDYRYGLLSHLPFDLELE